MKVLDILYGVIRWFYAVISAIWNTLLKILLILIIAAVICSAAAYGMLHNLYVQSRETEYSVLSNISSGSFRHMVNTRIYDADDHLIQEIKAADFEYTPINRISDYIQEGYIAVEDRDFKIHSGVNPKAIIRAALSIAKHGSITQGGSTITQQLVKNTLLSQEQTLSRKAVEALLAVDLEKKFTKADIMEYYLNSCYYGNGCYGVGSACRYYFGKKPADVTPAEAALIVGMSNNPNVVNPVASEEKARDKRTIVLKQMREQGVISVAEYLVAVEAPIEAKQITPERTPESYQSTYAVHCAAIELMKNDGFDFQYTFKTKSSYNSYKKRYEKAYGKSTALIRSGGYKIYTSLKQSDQKKLQVSVDKVLDGVNKKKGTGKKYQLQGAAVSIDNSTGYVTAIVGGRGTKDAYNRAFLASRQSGSSIKPLVDYGPAFDTGKYFPSLIVKDEPIENGPKNSGGKFQGKVSVRYAIQDSINTVAYNTLQDIGINKGLSYLDKLEFSSLSYLDSYSASVAIGGFTNGVHVTDMARGYSAIANGGKMWNRTCIRKISNEVKGTVYQEKEKDTKEVYSSATAYMLTSCMEDVFKKGGTGYGLLPEGQHCAGKTGTTNSLKDGWFCGFNTDYTCAVWVGNDDGKAVSHNYGAAYAGKIWKRYYEDKGGGTEGFDKPDTVVKLAVGDGGYPSGRKNGKKDYFSKEKIYQANSAKKDYALSKTKAAAEDRVSALEKYSVDSLSDYYSGYASLLKEAQDAVAAISDKDERKPYLERIAAKTEALVSEEDGWDRVASAEGDYKTQAAKDYQDRVKKQQEKKNRQDQVNSEVAKFRSYIRMVKGLTEYSSTQQDLLSKAYDALMNISDDKKRQQEQSAYDNAKAYVDRLKQKSYSEDTDSTSDSSSDSENGYLDNGNSNGSTSVNEE